MWTSRGASNTNGSADIHNGLIKDMSLPLGGHLPGNRPEEAGCALLGDEAKKPPQNSGRIGIQNGGVFVKSEA